MKILSARLLDMAQQEEMAKYAETRKSQVGTGDRVNGSAPTTFPGWDNGSQDQAYLIQTGQLLDRDLDEMIDALITTDQAGA